MFIYAFNDTAEVLLEAQIALIEAFSSSLFLGSGVSHLPPGILCGVQVK